MKLVVYLFLFVLPIISPAHAFFHESLLNLIPAPLVPIVQPIIQNLGQNLPAQGIPQLPQLPSSQGGPPALPPQLQNTIQSTINNIVSGHSPISSGVGSQAVSLIQQLVGNQSGSSTLPVQELINLAQNIGGGNANPSQLAQTALSQIVRQLARSSSSNLVTTLSTFNPDSGLFELVASVVGNNPQLNSLLDLTGNMDLFVNRGEIAPAQTSVSQGSSCVVGLTDTSPTPSGTCTSSNRGGAVCCVDGRWIAQSAPAAGSIPTPGVPTTTLATTPPLDTPPLDTPPATSGGAGTCTCNCSGSVSLSGMLCPATYDVSRSDSFQVDSASECTPGLCEGAAQGLVGSQHCQGPICCTITGVNGSCSASFSPP